MTASSQQETLAAVNPRVLLLHAWDAGTPGAALASLTDAVAEPFIVIAYSAASCVAGLADEKAVRKHDGRLELDGSIFRLLAFNARAELRWLRSGNGEGRAAVITEDGAVSLNGIPNEQRFAKTLRDSHQLLWGKISKVEPEWVQLQEGRIRPFWFPYLKSDVRDGGSLRLIQREYVVRGVNHGNARVRWARFIGVEAYNAPG